MTEAEFNQVGLTSKQIAEDIHMAAINLNTALHQFKRIGGNLRERPVLMRLLAQTELFLKEQGAQ
jgi:hypothetical protein